MTKDCIILINDKAGAFKKTPSFDELSELLNQLDIEAEIVVSKNPQEMNSLVKSFIKQGVKKIIVAGGDGTVEKVAQLLVNTDVVMGILPLGTANNFATALRIPGDLPSALRVIKDGVVQQVSVGRVNNHHYFTEGAGVGLFADALSLYGNGTNKDFIRGFYAFCRLLLTFRSHRVQITVDGKPYEKRALMCMVANTYRFSSALPIAPEAKLTDDVLDVIVVGDLSLRELWQYYRATRSQLHLSLPKIHNIKAKHIEIDARVPLNVHCDDHVIGHTPVKVEIVPQALNVLVEKI